MNKFLLQILLAFVIITGVSYAGIKLIEHSTFGETKNDVYRIQSFIDKKILGCKGFDCLNQEILRGDLEGKLCTFTKNTLIENNKFEEFKEKYDANCPIPDHYAFEPKTLVLNIENHDIVKDNTKLIWYLRNHDGNLIEIKNEYWYTNLDPYTYEEIGKDLNKPVIHVTNFNKTTLYFEVVNSTGYIDIQELEDYNQETVNIGFLDPNNDHKKNFIFETNMTGIRSMYVSSEGNYLPYYSVYVPIYLEGEMLNE